MLYHRTFGLDAEQLDELEARIENILPAAWDKGIGRPKSLSLRGSDHGNAALQAAEYNRRSYRRSFGVPQATVSETITEFTLLIEQATREFRPDAEEAKRVTRAG